MNCPNCGSAQQSDQQYCRSCGASFGSEEPRPANRSALWGLIMAFMGIAIALVGKMLLHQEIVTFVGVLTAIAGMFFIAAYPLMRSSRPNKRSPGRSSKPETLAAAEPTMKLPPINAVDHFAPSVTDGTTELLKDPAANRPNAIRGSFSNISDR